MPNPLKAYLILNDISGTTFAKKIDVHPSFLSRLMAGEREADATLLAKIEKQSGGAVTPDLWVRWWRKAQKESA